MESKKSLQFGKKYQVGNFFVFKYNRVLSKSEVSELRTQLGIPSDERKKLQRAQLPYIKVEAVSGIWSIYYCCNTSVFRLIDEMLGEGGEKNEAFLAHLFNMWFMDTIVPGDNEYLTDKAKAFKAFMERRQAGEVSEKEEEEILDAMKAHEEAKAAIVDIGNNISEGGDDDVAG